MPVRGQGLSLLDEDPELGAALPELELESARRLLIVPSLTLEVGPWDIDAAAPEPSLGLLLVDGLVTVNVVLGDRVASQLAGPGDVLHATRAPDELLPATYAHFVSERARLAVLDARFIAAIRRWPGLLMALHERLRVQERRLAVLAAIGKLRHVEHRLLALLWHLAERWGRVTPDGVVLPLALTHETLGRLSGAERPTVTLALGELARTGAIHRLAQGGFLLSEQSRHTLAAGGNGHPRARALSVVRTPDAPAGPESRLPTLDLDLLRGRLDALRADLPERARDVEAVVATARANAERSAALRARVQAERSGRSR